MAGDPRGHGLPVGARNAALLAWYRGHGRAFPWRATRDPYRILVSEVMLQQTQAARVVVPYLRFLDRFPTPEALAGADRVEVLAAWSGLGYNRRAIRLQDAVRVVVANGWPQEAAELQSLPGVGPYTAAAVAAFAFGRHEPPVDVNVRRVLSRWKGAVLAGASLREEAHRAVGDDAAAWTQAVMDLGATICRARDPDCGRCPVAAWCTDPTVELPRRTQGRFEGSIRQARGAVVAALVAGGPATAAQLEGLTGIERERLDDALEGLRADGMVDRSGRRYRIKPGSSPGGAFLPRS